MNKRVYGVLGISSIMSNWNADFTGYPKTTSNGDTFGSDKAFKYPMKKLWDNEGKKILYIKSMKLSENNKKKEITLVPRALKERYEQIFDVKDLKQCKDTKEVLVNLFKATDVKNFGATFAEAGNNISITGAVQIGQGFNKYEGTSPEEQQILSPFRDGSKDSGDSDEAKNSTLGTKIVSNEAHYFYPFTINPLAYKEFVELGVTDGYTEDDYKNFKETSLVSVTSFATNSKIGCENEFGLFVEGEEDLYLPNLSQYIEFIKGDDKNIIEIKCSELINSVSDKLRCVEIYYNPYTTKLKCDIKEAKMYNIFNQKEV
ncbi:CRISPR-associated protein [Clostridium botulinum]|uniref:CRISPR-associated protein n=1 Tax=Clostridium botulinum TaxID=1491 RepID=A0A6M0SRC6_CLOBO|nr:CRISPR-associated protein [Clostridium botulinum]NFO10828.1 CRISPR-associated protein [Clostridium botulinum]